MRPIRICEHCGVVGDEVVRRPGSSIVTIALLLLGIVTVMFTYGVVLLAWLAYETWRVVKTERGCPSCGKEKTMVLLDSPLGKNIWAKQAASRKGQNPNGSADSKACPFCAETVKAAAVLCRFCGRDLPAAPLSSDDEEAADVAPTGRAGERAR